MEMTPAEAQRAVLELLRVPGNSTCADCSTPSPTWASINLGVFICLDCSAHHRAMGTHISKVKSTTLDKWTAPMVDGMRRAGNLKANAYWERGLPPGFPRPTTPETRGLFIRQKYEQKKFLNEPPAAPAQQQQVTRPDPTLHHAQPAANIPPPANGGATDTERVRRRRAAPGSVSSVASSVPAPQTTTQPRNGHHDAPSSSAVSSDLLSLDVNAGNPVLSASVTASGSPSTSLLSFDSSPHQPTPSAASAAPSSFAFLSGSPAAPAPIATSSNKMSLGNFESLMQSKPTTVPTGMSTAAPALTQINAELDAISAKLKLTAISADQLRTSTSQPGSAHAAAAQQIKSILNGLGWVQVSNDGALEQLLNNSGHLKATADSLKRVVGLMDELAARSATPTQNPGLQQQLCKLKDELVGDCAKLDAIQMKRLDSIILGPNPPQQILDQRRITSAKAAMVVGEANALREKVHQMMREIPPSTGSSLGSNGGGFGFMQGGISDHVPRPPASSPSSLPSFLD